VASLSQGRTAAAQCGLFTHKSVPVIFEPPCTSCFFKDLNTQFLFILVGFHLFVQVPYLIIWTGGPVIKHKD